MAGWIVNWKDFKKRMMEMKTPEEMLEALDSVKATCKDELWTYVEENSEGREGAMGRGKGRRERGAQGR